MSSSIFRAISFGSRARSRRPVSYRSYSRAARSSSAADWSARRYACSNRSSLFGESSITPTNPLADSPRSSNACAVAWAIVVFEVKM